MIHWDKQIYIEDIGVGLEIPPISIPLTLQRLIMEAGANRDFSSIHHDYEAATATGAPAPYMNSFFILGMFERLLREWIGLQGRIKKIGPFRMKIFNCVGDLVTFKGKVREKRLEDGQGIVTLDIWSETPKGETVMGEAAVIVPEKDKILK
jgi:acyl dehydratase